MSNSPNGLLKGLAGLLDQVGMFDRVDLVEIDGSLKIFVSNKDASAVVMLAAKEDGPVVLVDIFATVVQEIDEEHAAKALIEVNKLNGVGPIGRWRYLPQFGAITFTAEQVVPLTHQYDEEEIEVFLLMLGTAYQSIDKLDDQVVDKVGSGRLAKQERPPEDLGPF